MSWVEFFGKTWPVADQTAEIRLHLWRPAAGCPRPSWSWNLFHCVDGPEKPDGSGSERNSYIHVEVEDLFFYEHDWRRLAGVELRPDSKWADRHEYTHEYGRVVAPMLNVSILPPKGEMDAEIYAEREWLAHDFILRIGSREGFLFPCELDAWLIPKSQYFRKEPELAAEVERFPQGPPNLRVLAGSVFTGGSVDVPRPAANEDPLRLARRYLREEIGLEEMHQPKMEWALRQLPGRKDYERVEGSWSTVHFRCLPKKDQVPSLR